MRDNPRQSNAGGPTKAVPSEGQVRLRVRYSECDPMGVAHHGAYAAWLELGRTEILRESGVSYADLEAGGIFLVITKLEIRYRRPIRYDDVIEVRTTVVGGGRVKIRHAYEVVLVERTDTHKEMACAVATTELGCVGADGRVRPLPDWLSTDRS